MSRGPGWWDDPYRHALAARGISSGYRMSNEAKAYISTIPKEFHTIKPVKGEIRALRDIIDLMDVFDRRSYIQQVPMGSQESGVVVDMVKNFKKKVKKNDIEEFLYTSYDLIDENLWKYKDTGNTKYLLMATDSILYILHNDSSALLTFIGRPIEHTGRDENFLAYHVPHVAMNLQRGFYGSSATEVGEGQDLLKWWINELDGRRLT